MRKKARQYRQGDFDWLRARRVGEDLAREQIRRGDPLDDRAIMWALLCEAVKVSAIAYKGPPFQGWPSKAMMPDSQDDVTVWQRVAAYLRGELQDMPEEMSRPPMPDAAAVTRSEHVLDLWHRYALSDLGDWARIRRAVYLKAAGMPDRKVRVITGFSRDRLKSARRQAVDDMCEGVGWLAINR